MSDNLDDSQEIKVSVCVITHNQEKYIAECLQSLLSQETSFKYEIIVGEDYSTDRTRNIVEDLHKKNPDLILKNFHLKNVGAVANVVSTYKMAKGKYICHMDGDDYALPGKLQAQYEALEANPDCVICSHDVIVVDSAGRKIRDSFKQHKKEKNTLMDLLETLPFFAHSSKMFRNDSNELFWEEIHPQAIDIEIHVSQAKKGHIYHINHQLGCYRTNTGISTQGNSINPILEEGANRLFSNLSKEQEVDQQLIKKFHAKTKLNQAYQSAIFGQKDKFIRLITESVKEFSLSREQKTLYYLSKLPALAIFLCRRRAKIRGYRF